MRRLFHRLRHWLGLAPSVLERVVEQDGDILYAKCVICGRLTFLAHSAIHP